MRRGRDVGEGVRGKQEETFDRGRDESSFLARPASMPAGSIRTERPKRRETWNLDETKWRYIGRTIGDPIRLASRRALAEKFEAKEVS
jgi:hypothetical protein